MHDVDTHDNKTAHGQRSQKERSDHVSGHEHTKNNLRECPCRSKTSGKTWLASPKRDRKLEDQEHYSATITLNSTDYVLRGSTRNPSKGYSVYNSEEKNITYRNVHVYTAGRQRKQQKTPFYSTKTENHLTLNTTRPSTFSPSAAPPAISRLKGVSAPPLVALMGPSAPENSDNFPAAATDDGSVVDVNGGCTTSAELMMAMTRSLAPNARIICFVLCFHKKKKT